MKEWRILEATFMCFSRLWLGLEALIANSCPNLPSLAPTPPDHCHQHRKVTRRDLHHIERGMTHIDTAVNPGNRNFLDIITCQYRFQSGLRVSCKMRLFNFEVLQNVSPEEFQLV